MCRRKGQKLQDANCAQREVSRKLLSIVGQGAVSPIIWEVYCGCWDGKRPCLYIMPLTPQVPACHVCWACMLALPSHALPLRGPCQLSAKW